MNSVILETKGLTKRYGRKEALSQFSITLEKGKIIGLLGPNGSGKTTFIKLCNGLIQPTEGELLIGGFPVGVETKAMVSYLPERTYLAPERTPNEMICFFNDFYEDFDAMKAYDMLAALRVNPKEKLKTMSKGTREKVQLILVMSRRAQLYMLDEPIGGVDPAARDYILKTILSNYNPEASILISTHLITDIEPVLDEVIFLREGKGVLHKSVEEIQREYNQSVDAVFREVFRCWGN